MLISMAKKDSNGELNEETKKELDEAMLEVKQGKCMSTRQLQVLNVKHRKEACK